MRISKKAEARPYHFGNLREALISAGLEVIAEQGVRALTLREIGDRVGVSRTAAYRHFADKAELLAAIGEIGFRNFAEILEAAAQSKKGSFARLEEMGVAYVRFALENTAHFEVMFGAGGKPQNLNERGHQVADRAFLALANVIAEGQKSGKFAGDDPEPVAQMVWALVHGISLLGLEKDAEGDAKFTRACTKVLRYGLQLKS